jgi:hypothetical protein
MAEALELRCALCGEAVEERALLADCLSCGRLFHLNPFASRPGKDCGDAQIGPSLGVETFCDDCLPAERDAMRPIEAPVEGRRRFRRLDES